MPAWLCSLAAERFSAICGVSPPPTVRHVFYSLPMASTPSAGAPGAGASAVEVLLAGLLAEVEAGIVQGLETDYAEPTVRPSSASAPAREPDEKAQHLAAQRAARAAAARLEVEDRFAPGGDAAALWALAQGDDTARDAVLLRSASDLLASLAEADRELHKAAGRRFAAVAAIAGPLDTTAGRRSDSDRHLAHEIAIAVGISKDAAHHLIAQALFGEYSPFGHALLDGTVSEWHARTLIEQTVNLTDPDARQVIGRLALPHAQTLVVADFRRELQALIESLDPEAVRRHQRAHDQRGVYARRGKDGMSFLGLTHDTPVIDAIMATLVADGQAIADQRRRDNDHAAAQNHEAPWDDADLRADAARADALMARVLGTATPDGEVSFDRAKATVITTEIVIDLDTLRGLADHVALINDQPAPADLARDLATWTTFIRRVVTDPVDGYLLDYGDRVYLPPALRRHCFARDRGCRSPGCTRRAARLLQLDHAEEHPHGPSSAANCGPQCVECHQRKTTGLLDITDSRADGSATFHTALGQTVRIPARPYLPRPPAVTDLTVDIEPPPF